MTAATNDPNLANNSQTVTTDVATQADLSLTKTTAAGPVLAGDTLAYIRDRDCVGDGIACEYRPAAVVLVSERSA